MNFNKLLIAVDSSPFSLKASAAGFELARSLRAEVALVYVIDSVLEMGNIDGGIFPDQARESEREAGRTLLQQLRQDAGSDLAVRDIMPEGNPRETLIETALNWEADLIVIGSHDRNGFQQLLSGSMTNYVLRHSPIPVLVVPTHKV